MLPAAETRQKALKPEVIFILEASQSSGRIRLLGAYLYNANDYLFRVIIFPAPKSYWAYTFITPMIIMPGDHIPGPNLTGHIPLLHQ